MKMEYWQTAYKDCICFGPKGPRGSVWLGNAGGNSHAKKRHEGIGKTRKFALYLLEDENYGS